MISGVSLARWVTGSYAVFLTALAVTRIVGPLVQPQRGFLVEYIYGIVSLGIAGITVPLFVGAKFGFTMSDPDVPTKRFVIGTFSLLIVAAVGIFLSGSFEQIMENRLPAPVVLKYMLVYAPMAMALTLQCFYLMPCAIVRIMGEHNGAMTLAIIAGALSLGIGVYADTGFIHPESAVTMTMMGLFFGTGAVLTRSVYLTALMLFLLMLSTNLAEAEHYNYSWSALVTGFVFCAGIFLLWRYSRLFKKCEMQE